MEEVKIKNLYNLKNLFISYIFKRDNKLKLLLSLLWLFAISTSPTHFIYF